MPAFRILVVCPQTGLAQALEAALAAQAPEFVVDTLSSYPAAEDLDKVLEAHPEAGAFIVDFTDPQQGGALLQALTKARPSASAAALVGQASETLAALADLKGASALIAPPFDLEAFADTLRDSAAARREEAARAEQAEQAPVEPPPEGDGKLIAFMPAQGGNGASTVSLHVANNLKSHIGGEKGVLFVDFDFHSGAVVFRLRLQERGNLAHALADISQLDENWSSYPTRWRDIDVLPAPKSDTELREGSLANVQALFHWFKARYPLTIVDMPTALYSSCRDIAKLADLTLLVCTPQVLSIHLARRRLQDLFGLGVKNESIRIVINRADAQTPVEVDDVQEVDGVQVISHLPNDYRAVNDAYLMGDLVSNTSKLGAELGLLSAKILDL